VENDKLDVGYIAQQGGFGLADNPGDACLRPGGLQAAHHRQGMTGIADRRQAQHTDTGGWMVELHAHDNIIPARWQEAGAHILYDPTRFDQPSPLLFDPAHWQGQGGLQATSSGRGSSWFIKTPAVDWVLRHYRRGGLP